jgi:hypothetical protein
VATNGPHNGARLGRTTIAVTGVFVLATLVVWVLYDLFDEPTDPTFVFAGLYTGLVALFFVGVPTVGVVVVLVQLPELLPVWAFRVVAVLGLMIPLPIFLALVSTVSGPQLLTQAVAQAVAAGYLIRLVSRRGAPVAAPPAAI